MTTTLRHAVSTGLTLLLSATALLAQGKDMGPAAQYYKTNPKFSFSHPTAKKDGQVKWTIAKGGTQTFVKDEYVILEGGVKLEYQDIKMSADKITHNFKTKDAVAEGHVIIDQGPTRLSADRAVYNLDSETGTFFNATGAFEPSIYLTAEKMEKIGETSYRITNAIFTSCDLEKPAWSFKIKTGVVTLDDYARLHGLEFRAHKLPLFWTPYLIWPTKKDRAQGFLIPRIGTSSDFGARLELGYFIPIGDSMDTTIYADLHTKNFFGTGVEVRYVPTPDIKGQLNAYTVNDSEGHTRQWHYQYKHTQDKLPFNFRGVVDVEDFSDLDFFRRYDSHDSRLHTLSQIYSSMYLTKNRENYSLNLLMDRRDILLSTTERQRFEQQPSLQFRLYPNRIGASPFYFSAQSSASEIRTSSLSTCPAGTDPLCKPGQSSIAYYRGDIFPTLSMQVHTPGWLSIKPQVSVHETYYSASLDPSSANTATFPPVTIDKALNRLYGQAQVEVVGPSLSRVFDKDIGGFTRFKHVIEPRVRYLYTTDVPDQGRVIRFDAVDTPFLPLVRNSVEYSLTQRIIAKEKGPNASSREILSFSISQSVSIGAPLTTSTSGTLLQLGTTQRFTPLTTNLHVNPYQSLTLDATTSFGTVSHQLDQASVSANLLAKDSYLSFTYFASYNSPSTTPGVSIPGSSQFRINVGSPLLQKRLRADMQLNYDATSGRFLEQRYLFGGNGSCYSVALEFRRFLVTTNARGEEFKNQPGIAITLKNVGTVGFQ
jgi:LPS-assembly protein